MSSTPSLRRRWRRLRHAAPLALGLGAAAAAASDAQRPAAWAVALPEYGVENLHRVAPGIYRSAQPKPSDVPALQKLGIRTVLSLRSFNSDDAVFKGSGIRLVRVPINTWSIDDNSVTRALVALRDAVQEGPVLIHCLHGADRTGVIVAAYRMTMQDWRKAEASRELYEGGYGYHAVWRNIPAYLERLDPQALREAVRSAP